MPLPEYVLLDRDGVINADSDAFIKSPDEWRPLPGSLEAIAELTRHGIGVVVISNQSGLARGLFDLDTLKRIHDKMQRMVEAHGGRITTIYFCPHGPGDGCSCRKPRPGLLQAFGRDCQVELRGLPLVGDSLRDIQAARAVGAAPILVKTGKGRQTLADNPDIDGPVFENLHDAVQYLLAG